MAFFFIGVSLPILTSGREKKKPLLFNEEGL